MQLLLFTPLHDSGRVGSYGFTLAFRVFVSPSVVRPFVFSFPEDNLSKYKWIFTKLGIANGQILSTFDKVISLGHVRIFVSRQYLE